MKAGHIRLHIEHLVIEGYSANDSSRISEALQSRLTQLLAERGIPEPLLHRAVVEHIDAGQIRSGGTSRAVGTALAGALYAGLKR